MTHFIVGILTFVIVINCLLLILLVLIQLPKKDAGAGLAFGGGAADALFGAGSGNVLTKVTKYATIVFLVLAWALSILYNRLTHDTTSSDFLKGVDQNQRQTSAGLSAPKPAAPPASAPASVPPITTPAAVPAAPVTPPPATPSK